MKNRLILLYLVICSWANAQTTWTDGSVDQLWSSPGNWSNGVPSSSTAVTIGTQPSGNAIVVDTGATTIGSLTISSALSAPFTLTVAGLSDALQVNGGITNNDSSTHIVDIVLTAGASATWTGPMSYTRQVDIGAFTVTLAGVNSFSNAINFNISNSVTYGRFIDSGTTAFSGTINIGGSYVGGAGDLFDFTTGNFSGASLGALPVLSNGLVWNTSNFITQGILTVSAVPEPATYAALFGVAALGFCAVRRRRKA
jgi:hypothetical protein